MINKNILVFIEEAIERAGGMDRRVIDQLVNLDDEAISQIYGQATELSMDDLCRANFIKFINKYIKV